MHAWHDIFWTADDGLRLHARDYAAVGEARPPVLCIHGLTRNARDFGALAPWLAARGHRVLVVDVRGRGGSAFDPGANYRLPVYVADLIALTEAAEIDRALFVGTSMGGLVTMELAATAPGLIAGAILNDIGPAIGEAGLARIFTTLGRDMVLADWGAAVAQVRTRNATEFPHYGADDWEAFARRLFDEKDGGVVAAYDPAIATPAKGETHAHDPWQAWDALVAAGPVLVLRGALSDILEADVAAAMADWRGEARVVELPGIGHAPMLDETRALEAIATFLDGIGAG